jgi:DNA-binding PadR family transcriptional regulator
VAVERDLAPGEWSVLALLAEGPSHGWALAKEMSASGAIGRVWSVGRPLVYRALELLEARGLVERVGLERGARGPNRELFRATDAGRDAVRTWLADPVEHVREIRSVFLLKLVLVERAGIERRPLLEAQRRVVAPALEALRTRLRSSHGSEWIFVRFRLESTVAVLDFIDALLAEDGPVGVAARK